jgi:hypothetical protein
MVFMNAGGGAASASASASAAAGSPFAPTAVLVTRRKRRTTYVLLAILFSLLCLPGIHNYYAGYWKRATVQLLVPVLSFLLFSFPVLLLPVWIWVFVEICAVTRDARGYRFA